MQQQWYKEWFNSPFYHKLYFERDEKEAEDFMERLLQFLKPAKGSSMLDVACGKGRHSKFLAEHSFFVTGIDISPESIEHALQYEDENLEFFQHDMRLPFRMNYYDYALNFFTSFGYFRTRREHEDAIRTIVTSLKSDGVFVIDYLNVHYAEDHFVHEEKKQIDSTLYEINRWHDDDHFYKKIRISDPSLTEPLEFTERVAKFSMGDFTDMLSYTGMQVTDVFGDYNLNPYHIRNTPRLILVAHKLPLMRKEDEEKRLYSDGRRTDAL